MQQERATERRPRPRIETLADLIFGLSLSIGAIALVGDSPMNSGEITSHVAAFIFTFLILITSWLTYTTFMSVLPVETRAITFLNVALLMMVALVPYLLNNVELVNPVLTDAQASAIRDYSSTLFALDLTAILLILSAFAHVISVEEKQLVAPELAKLFRNGRNRMLILAVLMGISVLPVFWQITIIGIPVRIAMWYLPLISYWIGRLLRPDTRTYRIAQKNPK